MSLLCIILLALNGDGSLISILFLRAPPIEASMGSIVGRSLSLEDSKENFCLEGCTSNTNLEKHPWHRTAGSIFHLCLQLHNYSR